MGCCIHNVMIRSRASSNSEITVGLRKAPRPRNEELGSPSSHDPCTAHPDQPLPTGSQIVAIAQEQSGFATILADTPHCLAKRQVIAFGIAGPHSTFPSADGVLSSARRARSETQPVKLLGISRNRLKRSLHSRPSGSSTVKVVKEVFTVRLRRSMADDLTND